MKKSLLIIAFVLFESFNLRNFWICKKFADIFYFSAFDLKLRLIEAINNTQGLPIFIIRIFNNKFTGTVFDLTKKELVFWNPDFLIFLLSFLGLFLFLTGIYFGIIKKQKIVIGSLLILLVFQLLEIILKVSVLYQAKVLILVIPYIIVSLFGFSKLYRKFGFIKLAIVFILLIGLTLWWNSVYPSNPYCV